MFELVEQQPSHLACPDVLNLSLGECEGHRATSQVGTRLFWEWYGLCNVLSFLLRPGPVPVAFDLRFV